MNEQQDTQLVLIVDDSPQNLQILGILLEEIDCDIAVASNGKDAVDIAREQHPDLILLDIMMPVMDGYEVCRILQEDQNTSDISIIFLTALSNPDDLVKGLKLGAVDYVAKPFKGVELLARVRNHLRTRSMMKELAYLNATKNKFFSIIAHDLKNPFYTIIGFSEMLMKNIDTHTREEQLKFMQMIYNSGKDAHGLLENLLNWSRIQIGSIRAELTTLSSLDLVERTVAFLEPMAKKKSIRLEQDEDSAYEFRGDENMMQTILRNLGSNAIKFTPPSGEVLILTRESEDGSGVEFIVKDNGIGMPEEVQSQLFRIDARGTRKGTDKEAGTGLGLILCKEFVEFQGGDIAVESREGEGSVFTVHIPYVEGEAANEKSEVNA